MTDHHAPVRRRIALAAAVIVVCAAVACGDDDSSPAAPSPVNSSPVSGQAASPGGFGVAAQPVGAGGGPTARTSAYGVTNVGGDAPGAVSNLAGSQISGQNAVRLTWEPPTTAGVPTLYTAMRFTSGIETIDPHDCDTSRTPTVCEVVYDALTYDPWTFTVYASNAAGSGERSSVNVTVTEQTASSNVPAAVTNLTATQAAADEDVVVSWDEPVESTTAGAAASYAVGYTTTDVRTVESSSCSISGCSETFNDVAPGERTWTVTPVNTAGSGTAATVTITVVDRAAEGPPGPVTNAAATQVGDTNAADVTWEAPTTGGSVTGYTVTRSGGTPQTVASCTSCSFRDDSLMFGVHTWTIGAQGPGGTSETTVSVNVDQPFTAYFSQAPTRHDGRRFTVRLNLSEDTDLSYRTLRDSAFELSNGRVTRARRVNRHNPGRNRTWTISVRPVNRSGAVELGKPASH